MNKKIVLIVAVFMVLGLYYPAYADTTIHLDIETNTGSLYNQDITVAPCDSDNAGTMSVTAYCAVLQSGIVSDWSWYGTDAFVNSIGGVANDYVNNIYWGWFNDLNYGSTALSAHTLSSGEHILLTFNINPLKITVSDSNPTQQTSVTITLSEFGLDSNFNPVWTGATGGSITINGNSYSVASVGTYTSTFELMIPHVISGTKTGFINSNRITLNPTRAVSSGGGGALAALNNTSPDIKIKVPEFNFSDALNYLKSIQSTDGSFGEELYTDWVAVAYGAAVVTDASRDLLVAHFNNFLAPSNYLLTDYERHTLALMALGLNPYNTNGENYIEKIVTGFDGQQFGNPNEDNDDIFALVVLQNAGFALADKMITESISFVLNRQRENGSWDNSVDMTGAALEALAVFNQNEPVKTALTKAENFLKQNQKDDGGWGNVSSTAWAIEGILALNQKPENWMKNGHSPLNYLAFQQDADGGMKNDNVKNKIWETSYVISALSGKTWNQIMHKFEKPSVPIVVAIPIEIKSEIKKIETNKIAQIKSSQNINKNVKNLENIVAQNPAASITAITDTLTRERTSEPVKKKNWFRRFFDIIFGF